MNTLKLVTVNLIEINEKASTLSENFMYLDSASQRNDKYLENDLEIS